MKSEKITTTIEVEVDNEWIDFATNSSDITAYCRYWMHGIMHDPELGWLVHEHDDERSFDDVIDMVAGGMPEWENIEVAWRKGNPLPTKWYRLDKAVAIKAFAEGVKRYGENWYDMGDAERYDMVVQLALLDEIRYG